MRRIAIVVGVSMFAVVIGAASVAAAGTDKYSFSGGSGDGGSCGNTWANDTYTLDLTVKRTGSSTYAVSVHYKDGSFVTIAGASPGACSTVNNHGTVVLGGIAGNLEGSLDLTETSAVYNPNGCASNPSCTTRTGVLAALFPGGVDSDYTYNFEYSSSDRSLVVRHWQDNFDKKTGGDKFVGDIATT